MDFFSFIIIIGGSWLLLSTVSVATLKYFNLKNPEIGLGYVMFRTTKINKLIDTLASRGKIFWQMFFDMGIIVSIGVLLAAVVMFGLNILVFMQKIFTDAGVITPDPGSTPTPINVTPAIPGLTISIEILPYFFIAILIAAALHELSHGIAARVAGIELKSTGLIFFLIFFAAFVEPDEESLKKSPVRGRLRVYASGALANVLVFLLLLILLLPPVFQLQITLFAETTPSGAMLVDVVSESPAYEAGLRPNSVITGIYNGTVEEQLITINDAQAFHDFAITTIPSQLVTIQFLDKENLVLVLETNPENTTIGYFGVRVSDFFAPKFSFLPRDSYRIYLNLLVYTAGISLMLALFNLLPVPPFDGSKLVEDYLAEKGAPKKVARIIQLGSVVILLGNLVLTFLVDGLVVM